MSIDLTQFTDEKLDALYKQLDEQARENVKKSHKMWSLSNNFRNKVAAELNRRVQEQQESFERLMLEETL